MEHVQPNDRRRTSHRSAWASLVALIIGAFVLGGCANFGPVIKMPIDPFGGMHGQ